MIFNKIKHKDNIYSNLLSLSRNIFFYTKVKLSDSFETRIYLMFFHFSILLKIFKKKGTKFDQDVYDLFFHNIENNLRELGFGDVTVNKKMKELNKILYDILLKFETSETNDININEKLIIKYFPHLEDKYKPEFKLFKDYFIKFYKFCFELSLNNVLRVVIKFKY